LNIAKLAHEEAFHPGGSLGKTLQLATYKGEFKYVLKLPLHRFYPPFFEIQIRAAI
jgi:hypothetical protein